MNQIWNQKVGGSLGVTAIGTNRTTGGEVERTVSELINDACVKSGVYGPKNEPVSTLMTVRELCNWHADFNWRLA